jgi:peptidoglycan/xylan/chitin deacetylase (PgdA/CDA1 family)
VGHHTYAHRPPTSMSDDDQRMDFDLAMEVFEKQGIPIAGYRAANWQANAATCDLVAEHGLYDSSLMADDRPYRVDTPAGTFIELPTRWVLDDWEQRAYAPEPDIGSLLRPTHSILRMWCDAFDACARHGALFMLTLHPELTGHADGVEALRSLIVHARARGAQFARCDDIAARAAADPDLPVWPITPPPTNAWPS